MIISMKTESVIQKIIRHIRVMFTPEDQIEMYRRRGVRIGNNCSFYSADIDCTVPEIIRIGNDVTITHATILAHDASTKRSLGYTKVGRVIVGNNVFIGWGAIVLPGVEIGENCIIGVGCVVSRNVPANSVVAGNPAKVVRQYDDYIMTCREGMSDSFVCDSYPADVYGKERDIMVDTIMKAGKGYIL